MNRFKVLVFNDHPETREEVTTPHPNVAFTFVPEGSRDDLLQMIPEFDGYVASLRIPVDQEVIERAVRLKVVGTNSTGTDHLDLDALAAKRITVISNKHDHEILKQVTATAELAFSLLLACARRLPECFDSTRQGKWMRHAFAGQQIKGKTLGIVGLGRLGTMMAGYGNAFQMNVIATDPHAENFPANVRRVDLQTLLSQSDFVSLHVHLTERTRHLLGSSELAMMKQGACLINTSRGGLVDEQALIEEMQRGRIAAAGLDVIDGEWIPNKHNHPLIAYSRENARLCITPHVGGAPVEAVNLTLQHLLSKMVRFFESGV